MSEKSTTYNHSYIEKKWQNFWRKHQIFNTNIKTKKKKFYVLEMFLYPSGNIHMGHVRNYTIGDVYARFKKMLGYEVLHPMGWDAFGLPAENAAISTKCHPEIWTKTNITEMKKELLSLGFSYDWNKEINTSSPEYFKHGQAMFIDFFHNNLVEHRESLVNWDPVDKTVLANEQVINGKGWRSGAKIENRKLKQWFLKITNFSNELLEGLIKLKDWPQNIKDMQKNWIGEVKGIEITFNISTSNDIISIVTTEAELLFGITFITIKDSHPLCIKHNIKNHHYTKLYAIHPINKNKIPIYVCNYHNNNNKSKLGIPGHNSADKNFANKNNLPTIKVVNNNDVMQNSNFLNNLSRSQARKKITNWIIKNRIGKHQTIYKLEDWCISRQRYWGCPIPIIHCKKCGIIPETKNNLPITLPKDVDFNYDGNPLDNHPYWKYIKCYKCGNIATRETDTFDTFFESSWYFNRYCSILNDKPFDSKTVEKWLPVDCYIGGIEHAILHLLYARFFTKALNKLQYFNITEPFHKILAQGIVCHPTYQDKNNNWLYPHEALIMKKSCNIKISKSEKMSKSKKNIISPTNIIKNYGADTIRLFILSDTPPHKNLEWSDKGIQGCYKYINNLYHLVNNIDYTNQKQLNGNIQEIEESLNNVINDVKTKIENLNMNKAISIIRTFTNNLKKYNLYGEFGKSIVSKLLKMLSVFIPHICEELWEKLGYKNSIHLEKWPQISSLTPTSSKINIVIQINGKTKEIITMHRNCAEKNILNKVKETKMFSTYQLETRTKKTIYVKNKVINYITS